MPQKILGIDLGSWSVKGVLLESSFRGFTVEAVHEEPIAPGEPDTKKQRQLDALGRLIGEPRLKGDVMILGFPGEQTTMRWVTLPYGDVKKIEQTLPGELADVLPFDLMDAVYDHEILERSKNESISLCAAAVSDHVGTFLESVQSAGVDPKFLPVDVLELYNLYTHFLKEDASKAESPTAPVDESNTFIAPQPGGPPDARLLVDIGHERTLVCACYEKGIAHVRVLRAGGRDVTEAIAKEYQLSFADAEAGKHEDALASSGRRPAADDASQKMAEVVERGLTELVRELRRTIQSIRKEKRVRVARIDLLGGGSRIKNLANYLAEQLNVPVAIGVAVEQAVEGKAEAANRAGYALALACALKAAAEAPVSQIDLRVGEFQFAGQLQHLRERAPILALAAGVLTVLMMINTIAQYQVTRSREAAIDRQFCEITQKVVGREICEPTVAISVVKQPASELGNFHLPTKSAFRIAAELSALVPKEIDMVLNEMEITPDRARLSGTTKSFDAVDSLVSAYAANKCFTDIKKGKLRKIGEAEGVEFQLSIQLECP
jgi:general secretion pathway protein L